MFEGFLAVRMDLKQHVLSMVFSCPHGPDENIFEGFLAVRKDLAKIFLKGF